ncbi:MAG: hypothetical protein ACRC1D_08875 [Culicoidibacterales bacterium]
MNKLKSADKSDKSDKSTEKSTDKNPYDLSKKATDNKIRKKSPKTYTAAEKNTMLIGYRMLKDPAQWRKLPIGVHVRLIKDTGAFLRGGFIKAFYDKDGKTYMSIENKRFNRNKGYFMWNITLTNVKVIFFKVDSYAKLKKAEETKTDVIVSQVEKKMIDPKAEKKFDMIVRAIRAYSQKLEEQEESIEQHTDEIKDLKEKMEVLNIATKKIIKYLKDNS